jgi:mono/diheme cytochrome c family protein
MHIARGIMMAAAMLLVGVCARAADPQAGRATALAKCAECHDAVDWEGEDAASLESIMLDIVAGKVRHRTPMSLTPTEIANIAAYWGAADAAKRR